MLAGAIPDAWPYTRCIPILPYIFLFLLSSNQPSYFGNYIVDAEIRGLFTKLVYNTHHVVGIPSTVGLLEISNKFLHITRYSILTIENLESFSNRRFMVCRRTWRQRLHSHRRRCAVFSRGSSDLSPPALRTLRRPSAAAITKADNTGCVTTGTANTSKMWQ